MSKQVSKQVRSGSGPIVESAVRNFTERGYHGTSMRDIATGAGVTVASIYHHFDSKQAVLQQIMVGTMTDLLEATSTAVEQAGATAGERLAATVDAWVLFHTTRQPEALIGASEIRSLDPDGRARVVELRDRQEAQVRAIVEAGVESGEFATPYPVEATRAIVTMGAAVSTWYAAGGPLAPDEMAARFQDLALGLVRA